MILSVTPYIDRPGSGRNSRPLWRSSEDNEAEKVFACQDYGEILSGHKNAEGIYWNLWAKNLGEIGSTRLCPWRESIVESRRSKILSYFAKLPCQSTRCSPNNSRKKAERYLKFIEEIPHDRTQEQIIHVQEKSIQKVVDKVGKKRWKHSLPTINVL